MTDASMLEQMKDAEQNEIHQRKSRNKAKMLDSKKDAKQNRCNLMRCEEKAFTY
jgi:hypothetical protein